MAAYVIKHDFLGATQAEVVQYVKDVFLELTGDDKLKTVAAAVNKDDYEYYAQMFCATFAIRNPRTMAGGETRWKDLVASWMYLAATYANFNGDTIEKFADALLRVMDNYIAERA